MLWLAVWIVDFSTGSVGLGSAAPLFGALADRFTESRLGASTGGRFISLLGDAELDEGNIWEALAEPLTRQLGNVLWIVDLNRQSLDRVIPGIRAAELEAQFRTSGWDVIELKYGRRLREAFARESGELLRQRIDEMPNEQYQSLFGASEEVVRATVLDGAEGDDCTALGRLLDDYPGRVAPLVRDLGGHDLTDVLDALGRARATPDRPTVIFALTSTQASFGRTLLDLSRVEGIAERLVTVAPDVSTSTNLGGFINKTGVWGPVEERVYDEMADSPMKWQVCPTGQHLEMGIAEMNLVLLLGQLGLTWDFQRERLFPIGTLYDPFVMWALEGIVYSTYSGSRFVLAGTPSGISLSREGGAHQSLITPGIGIETPGLTYAEPCYAHELEWLLLDALNRMQEPDGEALYLRLSTSPIDQQPFTLAAARIGEDQLRAGVVAGGFRLREPAASDDHVILAACGAIVPQALAAAELLADEDWRAVSDGLDELHVFCADCWQREFGAGKVRALDA